MRIVLPPVIENYFINGATGYTGATGPTGYTGATGASGLTWVSIPSSGTATGVVNQAAHDNSHFYLCYATNHWMRINIDKNF